MLNKTCDPEFINRWVTPHHLLVLGANYLHAPTNEQVLFNRWVATTLPALEEGVVQRLLHGHWREQLVGSWLCGLKGWHQFGPAIGDLLVASKTGFAGQGHCFALACFATEAGAAHLTQYLAKYLPRPDLAYNQEWAMPALLWIDEQRGTDHAGPFLASGGLWEQYCSTREQEATKHSFQSIAARKHVYPVLPSSDGLLPNALQYDMMLLTKTVV